jgi:maltooligosyltrehalose trehalohydrolase
MYWIREYHMDALRLDAVQTIYDCSPKHILAEIKENVAELARGLGREICVIAESDENDARLVLPRERGGYELDAFWSDDFHHAVHSVLTGERDGYYQDYGRVGQVLKALQEGCVFQGEYFKFWKGPRGTTAKDIPLHKNVICLQNHDQVGNRANGERLIQLSSWGQRHAAAALLLLAPETPLLFMGEEFDETAPFQFFTSFEDPGLAEAVRNGRREEFKGFTTFSNGDSGFSGVPDPQDPATFNRSKLHWDLANNENEMLDWYKALIDLRKRYVTSGERRCTAELRNGAIVMRVPSPGPEVVVVANLKSNQLPPPDPAWQNVLFAADEAGAVAVYVD